MFYTWMYAYKCEQIIQIEGTQGCINGFKHAKMIYLLP